MERAGHYRARFGFEILGCNRYRSRETYQDQRGDAKIGSRLPEHFDPAGSAGVGRPEHAEASLVGSSARSHQILLCPRRLLQYQRRLTNDHPMNKYIAEFIGTFFLVLTIGC